MTRFCDSQWDHHREHRHFSKLEEARLEVQARLARHKREAPVMAQPPRYDDAYFDGLNWLANLS